MALKVQLYMWFNHFSVFCNHSNVLQNRENIMPKENNELYSIKYINVVIFSFGHHQCILQNILVITKCISACNNNLLIKLIITLSADLMLQTNHFLTVVYLKGYVVLFICVAIRIVAKLLATHCVWTET